MKAVGSDREKRLRANRSGRRAERMAAVWLVLRGYRILARGFSVSGGEIDLVVRRGGVVAFVEVKQRATREAAMLAVTETKRRRIETAAGAWLRRNPWAMTSTLRGDALLLAPRHWPLHVADAFTLDIGF